MSILMFMEPKNKRISHEENTVQEPYWISVVLDIQEKIHALARGKREEPNGGEI